MEERGAWKVGLITILAIVGFLAVLAFLLPGLRAMLTGGRWHVYLVLDDVGGLQAAEKVVLAGVQVGTVDSVTLVTSHSGKEAAYVDRFLSAHRMAPHNPPYGFVRLSLDKAVRGQLFTYYAYAVGSTSLIGTTHQVSITPAPAPPGGATTATVLKDGDVVVGSSSMGLSDLAKPAAGLMSSLTQLSEKLQGLVGDPRLKTQLLASIDQMHDATVNLHLITDQARDLTTRANGSLSAALPKLNQTADNVQAMSANFRNASNRVPGMVNGLNSSLNQIRGNLSRATADADQAVQNINATTGELKAALDPHTVDQLHQTLANFRDASAHLNAVLGNVQGLTGNPALQNDLPAILNNLRDATAQLTPTLKQTQSTLATFQGLGERVQGVLPGRKTNGPSPPNPGAPSHQTIGVQSGVGILYSPRVDSRYPHRIVIDPEFQLTMGSTLYTLGLFDVGGRDQFTIERGRRILGAPDRGVDLMYGLYRSKVGASVYWVPNPTFGLQGSLYDPNNPTLDLEGALDFGKNYALWAGLDELNRHPRPVIGMRLKP